MIQRLISLLLALLYPLLVFAALSLWGVHGLGFAIVALGIVRLGLSVRQYLRRRHPEGVARPARPGLADWLSGALLLATGALVAGTDATLPARFYPVLVNVGLLCWFGWSLVAGPPVVERIARLGEPELPPEAVAYTRRVTWVWCAFFLLNGMLAAWTALAASLAVWTLYNGLIAYVLMGALFGIEYLVRRRLLRDQARVAEPGR